MTNWIGQQLGKYRLVDLIGQGSFADVYLGEPLDQSAYVAVKLLQVYLDDTAAIEQFHAETRTLARLVHPHIICLLDAGVEGGIPYLVMEYATGGTLRQRHPGKTILPLPRIIAYVQQIAAALQYAHEHRLIHRDVKPGNMFIGQHGTILLGDFGLALDVLDVHGNSGAMQLDVAGTVPYMAPEQLMGMPCYASDQYSLAAVVYEWLCGVQPLYDREGQLVHANPLPLRERVPGISPAVEEVVLIALSPDPLKRFNSVQDFATALEQAATGAFFDPGLLARTAEPVLSISTEDIELAQVVRKTDHRHSEALFTSTDVPLMSKSVQRQTAELLPRITQTLEEEQEADDVVVQAENEEKHDAIPEHDDAPEQDVPVAAVRAANIERGSGPQPYVVVDNRQSKRAPSVLTSIIFILLILIIISGIFAALHIFM